MTRRNLGYIDLSCDRTREDRSGGRVGHSVVDHSLIDYMEIVQFKIDVVELKERVSAESKFRGRLRGTRRRFA